MTVTISEGALQILRTLESHGYSAYIVGGAVRDSLMGRPPHDYDIATNALPDEVRKIFKKTIDTGLAHGTVTVVENQIGYEVTTFRTEGTYSDGRRPDSVNFVDSVVEDLRRRDFTINAMCYNPDDGVKDFFGGLSDIAMKVVRTVGNPDERFREDALRMLRAIRFSARLGFEIEQETANAIKRNAELIKKVSKERILEELNKILLSPNPAYIKKLHTLGLMKYIIPELDVCFSTPQKNKYHIYNVGDHIIQTVAASEPTLILRWSALLHDIGKPLCSSTDSNGIIHFYGHHKDSVRLARDILHRLRLDNSSITEILLLIENHDVRIDASPSAVKRMLARVGEELFLKLLLLQTADNAAKNPKYFPDKKKQLDAVRDVYTHVLAECQPYKVSHLAINGRDLLKLGFKMGREIGDVLKQLLSEVIINPSLNNRDYLFKRAKELHKKR